MQKVIFASVIAMIAFIAGKGFEVSLSAPSSSVVRMTAAMHPHSAKAGSAQQIRFADWRGTGAIALLNEKFSPANALPELDRELPAYAIVG
jgi:hypothetical protein